MEFPPLSAKLSKSNDRLTVILSVNLSIDSTLVNSSKSFYNQIRRRRIGQPNGVGADGNSLARDEVP